MKLQDTQITNYLTFCKTQKCLDEKTIRAVAFRAKCKMFSRHLQKPILKTEKGRFKGL